ncbi:MAG: rod shape-determining protein RodA, partial [Deltaproteobacteria bacterium]
MFDRRLAENFDWGLLGITLALSLLGLLVLYSAVTAGIPDPQKTLCVKQLIWYCAGLVAILIIIMFDYKMLDQ